MLLVKALQHFAWGCAAFGYALAPSARTAPLPDKMPKRVGNIVVKTIATTQATSTTRFNFRAGNATAFKPTSCPTLAVATDLSSAHLTLTAGYPSPVTAAILSSTVGAKPQLQLATNGSHFIYGVNTSGGLVMVSNEHEMLSLNVDGTFEYIAPGCSHGITGTLIPLPSSATIAGTFTSAPSSTVAARRYDDQAIARIDKRIAPPNGGRPLIEIDLTLQNQCVQPARGQLPQLECIQSVHLGAESFTYIRPASNFVERRNGQYRGMCQIMTDAYDICLVAETICPTVVQHFIGKGIDVVCRELTRLLIEGNFIFGKAAREACELGFEKLLSDFCSAESLNGDLVKCALPTVTPILALDYLSNRNSFTATLPLTTIQGAQSTTINPTATALVSSCSIAANPLPTMPPIPGCQYGQISIAFVLCNECYKSGLPWDQIALWDIECDICCGCCYPTEPNDIIPSGPASGPNGICCTKDNYKNNPNCIPDQCQNYTASYGPLTCEQPSTEDFCLGSGEFADCAGLDFMSLFDPNVTFKPWGWPSMGEHLCQVGRLDPPPK